MGRSSSWKDQIISEDPSQDSPEIQEVKRQPNWRKEVKADILELVDKESISSFDELDNELDYLRPTIQKCLKELVNEGVIEVDKNE